MESVKSVLKIVTFYLDRLFTVFRSFTSIVDSREMWKIIFEYQRTSSNLYSSSKNNKLKTI